MWISLFFSVKIKLCSSAISCHTTLFIFKISVFNFFHIQRPHICASTLQYFGRFSHADWTIDFSFPWPKHSDWAHISGMVYVVVTSDIHLLRIIVIQSSYRYSKVWLDCFNTASALSSE
jgi:hypothetical protein